MTSLRERNRRNAMRLTQQTALDLFIERGFDAVTVGEIAAEVGMAASTLYRHFETKEAIVLWDEHGPAIDDALASEFERRPPFEAMRRTFVDEIGSWYQANLDVELRRIRYIYETEQLHAAAVEADFRARAELTAALRHYLSAENRDGAEVLAGAALLAVDVAFDRWQQLGGTTPLGELIDGSFDHIAHLEKLR